MSTTPLRQYRFATAAQWRRGLRHRFDAVGDTLRAAPTFHLTASVTDPVPANLVAAGPGDAVYWRVDEPANVLPDTHVAMRRRVGTAAMDSLELVGILRVASRWVSDRAHFWAFSRGDVTLARLTRRGLTLDLEIDVARACTQALEEEFAHVELLDVAGDSRCGVWTLLRLCARAGQAGRELVAHFDARGCWTRHCWLPAGVRDSTQLAVTQRGASLVVLGSQGKILEFFSTGDCRLRRIVSLSGFGCDWAATRLGSDGRQRIAIAGGLCGKSDQVAVFDGEGDVLQGPLPAGDSVCDLALGCDRLWLATPSGLRLLASGGGAGAARESESLFITPLLESPITAEGRGWLRAELLLDLPAEGSVEAEFAGVDDADLLRRVRTVFADGTRSAAERRLEAWNQFDPAAVRRYVFSGKQSRELPVSIPVFETDARWLLLMLRVVAPPAAAPPVVHSLVVRYPERSIAENLPAIYRNRNEDPGGFFRRLLGVLESTTQRMDARIAGIGRSLDPRFASAPMLDYLAGWLGIPWDEGLDESSRRRLLSNAAALIRERGTRTGLRQLLRSVLGDQARIHIGDLTVDHGVLRLGGGACRGTALPALLPGQQRGVATLGERAVLGAARLPTPENIGVALDPLRTIVPTVRIDITAARDTRERLQPLLPNLLRQFLSAGVDTVLRWHTGAVSSTDEWALVLDDPATARLGVDQRLGQARLGGDVDFVLQ